MEDFLDHTYASVSYSSVSPLNISAFYVFLFRVDNN